MTYSDLVVAGIPRGVIDQLSTEESAPDQPGAIERREDEGAAYETTYERLDWASREVWLSEVWIRIDEDGDGYSELRRILAAGEQGLTILEDDEATHIPISVLCPVPIPHKLYGFSWADLIKDLQLYRSMLLRNMFDNIYLRNNVRYEVVENEVEIDDLLETKPGGYVRVSAPGMIQPLETPELGGMAMAMLEYLHGVKEDRTGITRYNQGRDAASLNQTATGISAIMEQANLRIEMIMRIFAETGVTRLFEQLLYVMRENKVREEVVRIRDKWVPMDPRMWRCNYDVECEVGLGTAQSAIRVDNLMLLYDLQKQVKEEDARMVTPENLFATVERIPEAMGFPTKGMFFSQPDFDEDPPEKEPDPKLLSEQNKQAEIQAKVAVEKATLEFRRWEALLDDKRERDRMMLDAQVRQKVAEIQAQATVTQAAVSADSREQVEDKRRWLGLRAGRKEI